MFTSFFKICWKPPVHLATVVISLGCCWTLVTGWLDRQPAGNSSSIPASTKTVIEFDPEVIRKFDLFHRLELISYDLLTRESVRFAPSMATNLGIVAITDQTVRRLAHGYPLGYPFGPPFPRHLYGRVIRELHRQGARAVGLDVLLPDLRKDHAAVDWVDEGETNLLGSDLVLAQVIRNHGNVILGALKTLPPAAPFRNAAADLGGVDSPRDIDGFARRIYAYVDCQFFSTDLIQFAEQQLCDVEQGTNGSIDFFHLDTLSVTPLVLAPDQRFRRTLKSGKVVLSRAYEERRVWNLGIVLGAIALGLDLEHPELVADGVRLKGTNGVERLIPLEQRASVLIPWSFTAGEVISEDFIDLLAKDILGEQHLSVDSGISWKNRLVVIGSIANGNNVSDLGATPLAASDYLIATYLNIANSLIQDRFLKRPPLWMELSCEITMGVIGAWAALRRRILVAGAMAGLAAVIYWAIAFGFFAGFRVWMPVAHPLISGLLLNHAVMLTWRVVFEQREQRRVRGIFSKIVSPDVVQELLRVETHALGGSRRRMTVFFADIRGFTEMTDQVQAAAEEHVRTHHLAGKEAEAYFEKQASEVLSTVNTYLATVADVIKLEKGTLDKYIGDCVMAFWGAPLDEPEHAVRGVAAAMGAQKAVQRLNEERTAENLRREQGNVDRITNGLAPVSMLSILRLGTGINTGEMTVGLMGSEDHIMNYTVFGRDVNLASRLEGVSGRSRIVIGEATYRDLVRMAPEMAERCRELEPVTVKGFRQTVPIFEVIWDESSESQAGPPK